MKVERADDEWFVVHIDLDEYLAFNNSLNWACNGINALEGDQYSQHLGAPEVAVAIFSSSSTGRAGLVT